MSVLSHHQILHLLQNDRKVCGVYVWDRNPEPPTDDEDEDYPCGDCPASQPWVDDDPKNTVAPECLCGKPMRGPFEAVVVWMEGGAS